jgi:hypothetical protein
MTFEDGMEESEMLRLKNIVPPQQEENEYLRGLIVKWGKGFEPDEYEMLEEKEAAYKRSYDIQTASMKSYITQICKLEVMCDRSIIDSPDDYKKYSDMLDKLSKSAKLTEAQRTEADKTGGINTFGQMIEYIEKQGFIPKWHTDEPQDIVDTTIMVLNDFTRKLVLGESNLSNLIDASYEQMNNKLVEDQEEDFDESELDKDFEFDDMHYDVEDEG